LCFFLCFAAIINTHSYTCMHTHARTHINTCRPHVSHINIIFTDGSKLRLTLEPAMVARVHSHTQQAHMQAYTYSRVVALHISRRKRTAPDA
jgi:hypothetical protein